jgi:hypothetical protein
MSLHRHMDRQTDRHTCVFVVEFDEFPEVLKN